MKTDLRLRRDGRLTYDQVDSNFNRLAYWSGLWVAGTYETYEIVRNRDAIWSANIKTATEPMDGATDWDFVATSVPPGYGVMGTLLPTPGPPIGAGWTHITEFDNIEIDGPDVSFNTTTGHFTLESPGVWEIDLMLSLAHNESNTGRVTNLRIIEQVGNIEIGRLPIGIARNQSITVVTVIPWFDVIGPAVGLPLAWELGGGDGITDVTYELLQTQIRRLY